MGKRGAERVQTVDEGGGGHERIDRDRQLGLDALVRRRDHRLEAACAREHHPRLADQHATDIREPWTVAGAVEQHDAVDLFECRDGLADGRLSTEKLAARGREAAGFDDRHQHAKLVKRETANHPSSRPIETI